MVSFYLTVKCVKDKSSYFAEKLYKSMKVCFSVAQSKLTAVLYSYVVMLLQYRINFGSGLE